MVDRECENDKPALVTKVTRRQSKRRTDVIEDTSAAVIVRHSSSTTSATDESDQHKLPLLETYTEQKKGRNPYLCIKCNKKFAKSSLNSHIKSKHKGKPVKVSCCLCEQEFDRHTDAQEHVSASHRVYACTRTNECEERFSEFDRLKSHLKTAHAGSEWPWICGFCDLVLFYELEFQVHVRQHTERAPFVCPLCARVFSDNSRLREHLARQHLPTKQSQPASLKQRAEEVKLQKHQEQLQKQQFEAFERLRTAAAMADNKSKTKSDKVRDENAVNREIAALLLNLHASSGGRSQQQQHQQQQQHPQQPRPEDLSLKTTPDTAIDLTKSKPEITLTPTMPASITKLVKGASQATSTTSTGVTVTKTKASSAAPANYQLPTSPAYPFYPSLASMTSLSPTLAMNSNYLLQNLLLGKMQQIANSAATATTTASSSNSMSLPTQPLPAQALSMPSTVASVSSLKPPAAVFKSTTPAAASTSSSSMPPSYGSSMQLVDGSNTATNIPLLCGQIVSQLNGLLFHQHNLNNVNVEINLQTQLSAIYTRLQEVVAMVEQAKKQQEVVNGHGSSGGSGGKHDKKDVQKQKEEEKIAKHIQEYQRALLKEQAGMTKEAADTMVSMLKKQAGLEVINKQHADSVIEAMDVHHEAESSSPRSGNSRRRGRPPKNSNMDLSYSPPEKRSRDSFDAMHSHSQQQQQLKQVQHHQQPQQLPQQQPQQQQPETSSTLDLALKMTNGSDNTMTSSTTSTGTGKGGKGIRNRVFCGECTGCLKNDDCGKCRYCKDKTKFGGQNRLRQKCLHRRCQLDTHRRRASQNGGVPDRNSFENSQRQSPSPDAIYSGVDLARLASQQQHLAIDTANKVESKINGGQLSPGEIVRAGQLLFPQGVNLGKTADEPATITTTTNTTTKRSRPKSGEKAKTDGLQRSQSRASNCSDEDSDEHKLGKSQSRIDKWKAKHEAMLKMAGSKEEVKKAVVAKEDDKSTVDNKDSGEEEEADAPKNGVVAAAENEDSSQRDKENKENKPKKQGDDNSSKPVTTTQDTKKTTTGGGKEASGATSEEEHEIPNIEPTGVCIEFERKNISKPPTRHNTVPALSV